jgi:uncharacterized protein
MTVPGRPLAIVSNALMDKYGNPDWDRPKSFFPRLDQVTVYVIAIERMIGKEMPLPWMENQWPIVDNTK